MKNRGQMLGIEDELEFKSKEATALQL